MSLLFVFGLFVSVALTGVCCLYFLWKRNILDHLPSMKQTFPFGHMHFMKIFSPNRKMSVLSNSLEVIFGMVKLFEEEGMTYFRLGFKNLVILSSANTAEVLLSSKEEIEKSSFYEHAKALFGDGLVVSKGGNVWKFHRKIIRTHFHTSVMERTQVSISDQSSILINKLSSIGKGSAVEISKYLIPCTFDIIAESVFGTKFGAQKFKDLSLLKRFDQFSSIWGERFVRIWLYYDSVFYQTDLGRESQEAVAEIKETLNKILIDRQSVLKERLNHLEVDEEYQSGFERPCLLDLLLNHQLTNINSFTDEQILDEVITVISAGFETTVVSMTWALFLIGHHPEVQNKIHEEIDEVFRSDTEREITSQDINNLKYLECVVKESLRLSPTIPVIARTLKKDFFIEGKKIPKGTDVLVFIAAIHRSPKYYDDPEKFQPERFLPENSENRHPYAYLPFAAGLRKCTGAPFAQRSSKTIMCSILRKFRIESVTSLEQVQTRGAPLSKPDPPIFIKLHKRSLPIENGG